MSIDFYIWHVIKQHCTNTSERWDQARKNQHSRNGQKAYTGTWGITVISQWIHGIKGKKKYIFLLHTIKK